MTVFDLGLVLWTLRLAILETIVPFTPVNTGDFGVGDFIFEASVLEGETLGGIDRFRAVIEFCDNSEVADPNRVLETDAGMFERRRRKSLPTELFDSREVFEVNVASTLVLSSTTPLARLAGPTEGSGGLANGALLPSIEGLFEDVDCDDNKFGRADDTTVLDFDVFADTFFNKVVVEAGGEAADLLDAVSETICTAILCSPLVTTRLNRLAIPETLGNLEKFNEDLIETRSSSTVGSCLTIRVTSLDSVEPFSEENDHAKLGGVDGGELDIDGEKSGESRTRHAAEE